MSIATTGCRAPRSTDPGPEPPPYPDVRYEESEVSADARVFLVAGGDDIANFGAEIAQQRRQWIEAGLPAEQIACYHAAPTPRAWDDDFEQYREVLPELSSCHRASPERVLADLHRTADRDPPWIYLYVSAHGIDSLLGLAEAAPPRRLAKLLRSLTPAERELLDTPAIGLQAGPSPRLEEIGALVRAHRSGAPPGTLMFTPQTLGRALAAFGPSVKKYVVLQACFSGAFTGHGGSPEDPESALADVENLVVLTATARDRPSFGCDPGTRFTYFGGAYALALERALATAPPSPVHFDWAELFERASFAVEVMEAVQGEEPSRPGYFTTLADDGAR
jgi:hypothetical protein